MDPLYEEKYHERERNYWWFKARREAIYKLLNFYNIKYNSKILDIGCSSGLLLEELYQHGYPKNNLYGIDISKDAVNIAKSNGFENVQIMDGSELTFKNESMDVIISSDSLEHIKWDKTALKQWHQCLRPGGMLVVFVPAFNCLWSEHDEINSRSLIVLLNY
ncbi:MAG: class I SAM-dependent methyltransferase [Balneolaceae bacterium]|nr:class I SAM-dependent methyltransferase [Balneolaceae bacterium]